MSTGKKQQVKIELEGDRENELPPFWLLFLAAAAVMLLLTL